MATSDLGPNDPCGITTLEQRKFAIDCNGEVTVRVSDDCSLEVLEAILAALGGSAGTPFHLAASDTTAIAGTPKTVLTSTVPAATTRKITKVIVSTRAAGSFDIIVGGSVVGSGRTNASNLNVEFLFDPNISVSTGVTIDVDFTTLHGPSGSDIEVYLMAMDV